MGNTSFQETWLWRRAFVEERPDANKEEQEFFRQQFLLMRDKTAELVSFISADMPGLTVHDISHLDALWDIASLLTEGVIDLNPAEAFVFGAAVLLHDAGLTIAAYPNGIDDLQQTEIWKDIVATIEEKSRNDETPPSPSTRDEVVVFTLRRLHAERASELVSQPWFMGKEQIFLINETELRRFYGSSIGKIAHSHWWPLTRVEDELDTSLGAFMPYTRSAVNRLIIACLLRVADALHLDRRRAPLFRRAIQKPAGKSADHWAFQERLAAPQLDGDNVFFTASEAFPLDEADAWWLAFDTIAAADKELSEANLLLTERYGQGFRANRIKGASSPKLLSRLIPTQNWIPVESKVHISDVPKVVETLGGAKLYGDDPSIAIRELIQNARDAVEARRRRQNRSADWGCVNIRTFERANHLWLSVEDNGVGMSERVLTGPLLDFGQSIWNSDLLHEEFPGLAAAGMKSIGRFGIGFFSVFMLGQFVRVVSRPYDKGEDQIRVLEFHSGLKSRPIMYAGKSGDAPIDGGTRVEILVGPLPSQQEETGTRERRDPDHLGRIVGALAPAIDVSIDVNEKLIVKARDWLHLSPENLCARIVPFLKSRGLEPLNPIVIRTMQNIRDKNGLVIGRACIFPTSEYSPSAVVTVGGLSAAPATNIIGLVAGIPIAAARDQAEMAIRGVNLKDWATQQAELLKNENLGEHVEAKVAEIVLECGGDPQQLSVVKYGNKWFTRRQVERQLEALKEVHVLFGDLDHADYDPVPKLDFEYYFKLKNDVMLVPTYDGRIRSTKKKRALEDFGVRKTPHRVTSLFKAALRNVWGAYKEDDENEAVGSVNGIEIERPVTIYSRA
jgi:signal transduction histidine kinase